MHMPLGNNIVNGGYSPCASFSKLIHGNHSDKTLHAKGILDPGVVCFKEINNLKSRNLPSSHHQTTSITPLASTSGGLKNGWIKSTASKRVLTLRTWSLIRTFFAFWVLIHISGSLFSLFWFHSRKECQFSLHVYIFAGIGSGLHCWQILILTYAYA